MTKTNFIIEPGQQVLTMTRTFNAPRALVFKAYTDPNIVPQWYGKRDQKTTVDRMEVKKGGVWRYVIHDTHNNEYAFNGVYHTVTSPELLVNTFEFEGMAGHIGLITTIFTEQNGQTLMTEFSLYPSVEDRDGVVASGMEDGAVQSMDRFEECLAKAK
jgi:uncharacterized protein YndB with AHSA1/START domain